MDLENIFPNNEIKQLGTKAKNVLNRLWKTYNGYKMTIDNFTVHKRY